MTKICVKLTANGKRSHGKSTVLQICREALTAAGYAVSNIVVSGDEVISEEITVVTGVISTEVRWLKQTK